MSEITYLKKAKHGILYVKKLIAVFAFVMKIILSPNILFKDAVFGAGS